MRTYAHAWHQGYDTGRRWGRLTVLFVPWWRGYKYLTAWTHGARRGKLDAWSWI